MAEINEVSLDRPWQDKDGRIVSDAEVADAIDLASDQGQRTWLTSGGKRIAAIVTTEDAELLDQLHQLCHCGPHDWKDDCPLHGAKRIGH